jgi:uncharacterized membrane protein
MSDLFDIVRRLLGFPMELSFLAADLFGTPAWLWLAFIGIVIAVLAFDLGLLHREHREIDGRESLVLSAVYIGVGLGFGAWVWWYLGFEAGMNYLTGFAVEKALAMGLDKVPPALSLSITFGILAAGVLWSAWKTRRARKEDVPAVG